MTKFAYLLALGLLAPTAVPATALGQHHSDQRRAFEARREGRILPVREIERRVIPSMGGAKYIGFDFDGGPAVYTLKFLRDGQVIWVDVDGRTGTVLGRTGR
jgi:uncharacterized membrane protein YkoI